MKAQERHHLKQNEFAATMVGLTTTVQEHGQRILLGAAAVVLIVGVAAGYYFWRKHTNDQAGAMFATAMAISESQIAPPPSLPGATQAPGTFPTATARQEAAVQAFQKVAAAYPGTPDGLAASYHLAGDLVALGRLPEGEKAYQDVLSRAGSASIYGSTARMGLAETFAAEGHYDQAIKEYSDLAAQRDGALPVDGVLLQLARTYVKAKKTSEARAAFKRIVDEFPDSNYVAEARQQMTLLG